MATTTHLGITLVEQSQAQKEITVNEAFVRADAVLNNGAKSRTTATPPGSPAAGDLYIVATSPTGDWSGHAGKMAYFDQIWRFIVPLEGMMLWVNDEDTFYIYSGSIWQSQALPVVSTLSGTAHTLDGSYVHKTIQCTNASAITLTLPNNLYTTFNCRVMQLGAGQITFAAASGATIRNRQSHSKAAGQWAVCDLLVISNSGGSAAEYLLSGDTGV